MATKNTKKNKFLTKLILTLISVVFGLLLAEGVARIFLDPVDYLKPRKIEDEILGFKLGPTQAGMTVGVTGTDQSRIERILSQLGIHILMA